MFKKGLALLLALVMIVGMAACQPAAPTTGNTQGNTQGNSQGNSQGSTGNQEPAKYTYNLAWGTFPSTWNPHTYETSTDSDVLSYVSDGFYGFDYNEDETGFAMVPAMVKDDHPIDVTKDYVGKYGIKEGDEKLVWKINLREDLKWQNGDKITANDFVESAKRLLNPVAKNYRADTLYSGDVTIVGAESYYKQGSQELVDNGVSGAFAVADLVKGDDGVYTFNGTVVYIAVDSPLDWCGGNSLKDYVDAYGTAYFGMDRWEELVALVDDRGLVALTDDTMAMLSATTTTNPAWGETDADLPNYMVYDFTYPEVEWDGNVGIFATGEYELVYVITKPLDGFYLKYGMPSGYLVHIPTYDKLTKVDENGSYTNTYNTSAETTMSYGTYNMINFQLDKVMEFERSTTWYDLTDDTYMTTNIHIQKVEEASTRLNMFLKGELDTFGLAAEHMETYGKSDMTYYAEGASTFAITFNPDFDALETEQKNDGANINKTIITLIEFRQAFSFGLDRSSFCAAVSPTNTAAFGLYSTQHIVDPETGAGYRGTEQAKDVLIAFWGLKDEIGEGKLYATKDEAIASLTGYNPEAAKEKFNEAYDRAIAEGLMDEDDVICITIGLPSASASFYVNGYDFLVNNYTELVKGTKLEGKLTFDKDDTIGNSFASALQSNQVNMLFGVGWSGMELNPYGLMQAYVEPNYQYDAITDFKNIFIDIEIDGTVYTAAAYNWYLAINGDTIKIKDAAGNEVDFTCGAAAGKYDLRLFILSKLEECVLMNYNFIPAMGNATAQLKGMQIQYYHEDYMFGMGWGGIKYMTYNYTDAEWAEFVASKGGELDYT